jgi:hypothetical protein
MQIIESHIHLEVWSVPDGRASSIAEGAISWCAVIYTRTVRAKVGCLLGRAGYSRFDLILVRTDICSSTRPANLDFPA